MITKQELNKLKDLASKCNLGPWESVTSVYADGHGVTLSDEHNNYIYNADPNIVLRLIEALEFATEALIESLDDYSNDNPQYAKQALEKIYGPA